VNIGIYMAPESFASAEVVNSPTKGELLCFLMLACLRKENYEKLGLNPKVPLTDEEKAEIIIP
jgi:hypothetical protein